MTTRDHAHPRRLCSGAALSFAAGLVACTTAPAPSREPMRTSESPAAIDVTVAHRVLAVRFVPDSATPAAGQIEALNVLLGAGDIGRGDTIVIERGPSMLADNRAHVLAAALAREGLRPTVAETGDVGENQLRLVIAHADAHVLGCPNWSKPPGNDAGNTLPSDFGCASAMNLAAAVADPRDLIEGRPLAPVVGDAAVVAVHRYRAGAPESPEATAPVVFPDIDRQGRTTTAAAPARSQHSQTASAPAAGSPPGSYGPAAAAASLAGAGGTPR